MKIKLLKDCLHKYKPEISSSQYTLHTFVTNSIKKLNAHIVHCNDEEFQACCV